MSWQHVDYVRPALYGLMNITVASGIVFANKAVFSVYGFHFTCALTWVHTAFTMVGMRIFAASGMFDAKPIPWYRLVDLAAAFVAYIVLCNLSLNINTVSFYQIGKIAVAPTIIIIEAVFFRKVPKLRVLLAIAIVCVGIGLATVNDAQVASNAIGLVVGLGAVVATSLYQIWAGTKQRTLEAGSSQLLHQYTPIAMLMLGVLVPCFEPLGSPSGPPDSILGFSYTLPAVCAILVSACLGLLVTLSTFLVIGATSSLTYNVVGHVKTIIILLGGCVFFGDEMPLKRLAGIALAMVGIIWYSQLKLQEAGSAALAAKDAKDGSHAGASRDGSSKRVASRLDVMRRFKV